MLEIHELININYIPTENDLSLNLLIDFYEEYLNKRKYVFKLCDGSEVILHFANAKEIYHLSGIDHIYEGVPMDGTRFIKDVKDKKIDFESLRKINAAAYKDYSVRICSLACIDTILKKCEYLYFANGIIPDSTIEVKYLLLKGLDGKNLHLGIDTYKEGRPYYSKTLLITEGNNSNKFIDKAEDRLRVSKLEIRERGSNKILESIERQTAEHVAYNEVKKIACIWIDKNLTEKIIGVCTEKTPAETESILDTMSEQIGICIKKECINSTMKRKWKNEIKKYLESQKEELVKSISNYDPYWASKIAAESIRKYEKEHLMEDLEIGIEKYLDKFSDEKVVTV